MHQLIAHILALSKKSYQKVLSQSYSPILQRGYLKSNLRGSWCLSCIRKDNRQLHCS